MAGTCNVACAEGHLSLARQRARIDPKKLLLVSIPPLDALFLPQGRGAKRSACISSTLRDPGPEYPNPLHPVAGHG